MARKVKRYDEGGITYEGSDEDALATAKRMIAEKDAAYAAANPARDEEPAAPKRKKVASKPKAKEPSRPVPAYPEDGPRRPSMTAPVVRDIADKVRSGYDTFKRGTDMKWSNMGMKAGGAVKSGASKRADGCAQRGKTKGRMV